MPGSSIFSSEGVRELTHVITDYLKAWIRESLPVPACRSAMIVLAAPFAFFHGGNPEPYFRLAGCRQ